jgi:hypothetical protein
MRGFFCAMMRVLAELAKELLSVVRCETRFIIAAIRLRAALALFFRENRCIKNERIISPGPT